MRPRCVYDAVLVPSGAGPALAGWPLAQRFLHEAYRHGKPIAVAPDADGFLEGGRCAGRCGRNHHWPGLAAGHRVRREHRPAPLPPPCIRAQADLEEAGAATGSARLSMRFLIRPANALDLACVGGRSWAIILKRARAIAPGVQERLAHGLETEPPGLARGGLTRQAGRLVRRGTDWKTMRRRVSSGPCSWPLSRRTEEDGRAALRPRSSTRCCVNFDRLGVQSGRSPDMGARNAARRGVHHRSGRPALDGRFSPSRLAGCDRRILPQIPN